MITISPGHWTVGTGARDLIDEVTEARRVAKRVTEILRKASIQTNYIEDNVSKNQNQNLTYLVTQHNKTTRQLDVSVHFNASSGRQTRGIGVEVLYYDAKDLAAKVSKAISNASGLIDRGAKQRREISFLSNTNKPAILLEICFVNSTVDTAIYNRDFEKICQAIAKELAAAVGKTLTPTTVTKPTSAVLKGRELVRKAVKEKVFTSPHNEVDSYSTDKLLELALTYIERKIK